jgi:arsenate reductase (thioredoxin)
MKMPQNFIIIFVCEHGAAKSILAAAYFNKLAREHNLGLTAIARGTHPDAELSPKIVDGLRADGLIPTESIPTKLDEKDLDAAQRIVSFCALSEEYHQQAPVEYWKDVPPVSEDYERARDVIVERLKGLLNHL